MEKEFQDMIADYMEKGFLENIIDMFKHDHSLCCLIGELIQDDRMRVRIGVTALVEELSGAGGIDLRAAVPGLLPLLHREEPVIRGDAVNLLGIIGDESALPALEEALADADPSVRMLAGEAMADIRSSGA